MRRSAKKTLEQALHGYIQARLDKGRASESAGRFIEALAEYSKAVEIADEATAASTEARVAALLKPIRILPNSPRRPGSTALRGDVFIKDGEFEEALKEYRAALGFASPSTRSCISIPP